MKLLWFPFSPSWLFFFSKWTYVSFLVEWTQVTWAIPCLSVPVCQVLFFKSSEAKKKKKSHLPFFFYFLLYAVLSYLTAPLLFSDTLVWTRARECWPSNPTLQQAATGWGSVCLTECGPTCSPGSEFMSGSWRKSPSCCLPRCVWLVTLQLRGITQYCL